jgi:hypothetical protein
LAAVSATREALGGTYRRLSKEAGVGYRSLMRWRGRQRRGKPLLAFAGQKKVVPLEVAALLAGLRALEPGPHRTPGTGKLYRRFQDQISRRVLAEVVEALRREYFHARAAAERRISWNAPGVIWSVDDMEMGLAELGWEVPGLPKAFWNQVRDLSSRHQFEPGVTASLAPGELVAVRLETFFELFGPPLFLKRDNHGNLNQAAMEAVLARYGVIPLNSPPYYAPYNGGIEAAQWEFQKLLRAKLRGQAWSLSAPEQALNILQLHSELVAQELNHRRRPCLKGATACRVFEVGKQQRRFYYDRRQRREVFEEIRAMASLALAETGLTGERAASAAWRLSVETWMRREGLIAVSVGGKVLPYFR